jgi:putative oxidoreductase
MPKELLLLKSIPTYPHCALLALRLTSALLLFFRHGSEKLFAFSAMSAQFPNPLHIGAVPSLMLATLSDAICPLFVILGLATRWAALIIFVNIGVAFALVHHFALSGPQGDHGEMIVLYLAAMAVIFLSGPGSHSLDAQLDK